MRSRKTDKAKAGGIRMVRDNSRSVSARRLVVTQVMDERSKDPALAQVDRGVTVWLIS